MISPHLCLNDYCCCSDTNCSTSNTIQLHPTSTSQLEGTREKVSLHHCPITIRTCPGPNAGHFPPPVTSPSTTQLSNLRCEKRITTTCPASNFCNPQAGSSDSGEGGRWLAAEEGWQLQAPSHCMIPEGWICEEGGNARLFCIVALIQMSSLPIAKVRF